MRLEQLLQTMHERGELSARQLALVEGRLAEADSGPPWYVRLLIGISAWIASLLMVGFVLLLAALNGLELFLGAGLIALSVFLRRADLARFANQMAVALALTGQALCVYFVINWNDFDLGLAFALVLHGALFIPFPDRIHRALSLLFAFFAAMLLLYRHEQTELVTLLAAVPALALYATWRTREALFQRGFGHFVWPLQVGLVLASVLLLAPSCAYLLPELGEPALFPTPWLTSLLLLPLWCLNVLGIARRLNLRTKTPALALALLVGLLCLPMPGTLFGLLLLGYGLATAQKAWTQIGLGFLLLFLLAFFYGNQLSMPVKALSLMLCGTAVLGLRFCLREEAYA